MTKVKVVKSVLILLCGFSLGAIGMLLFVSSNKDYQVIQEVLKPGDFGDVGIFKGKSSDYPDAGEVLAIANGDDFGMALTTDSNNVVNQIILADNHDRRLIEVHVENGLCKKVFVLANGDKGGFMVEYDHDANTWHNARYCRQADNVSCFTGEEYIDIDFDGSFDVKSIWDPNAKSIKGNYMFINDQWQPVGTFDIEKHEAQSVFINGKFQILTFDDEELIKELAALPMSAKKKVYYDFIPTKGWKQSSE